MITSKNIWFWFDQNIIYLGPEVHSILVDQKENTPTNIALPIVEPPVFRRQSPRKNLTRPDHSPHHFQALATIFPILIFLLILSNYIEMVH
jgi:hypothetical protein